MECCAIYGLESQGRALCSHLADQDSVQFLIGTLSPRSEGLIHLINFNEESNHITRKIYKPKIGEIWQIKSAPSTSTNLIGVTYNDITATGSDLKPAIVSIPNDSNQNNPDLILFSKLESPELQSLNKCRGIDFQPTKSTLISTIYSNGFALWDLSEGSPKIQSKYFNPHLKINMGKWNPHLDGNQFGLICGTDLKGIDTRSMQPVWEFKEAHRFQVRDLDFNPNKQYYFATCGDDCKTRFWDIRKPQNCLEEIGEHSHWIWTVRFNSYHDHLVLTAGSDARVVLHSLPKISSEVEGKEIFSEGEEEFEVPKMMLKEGVIAKYEEHEDAVYAVEWAGSDPWIFAALSYDGRLVINRVPQGQKQKILL